MGKPFQFSIRRMLGAMAWFCVAAGLFAIAIAHTADRDGFVVFVAAVLCVSAAGGGIGAIAGNARKGGLVGFVCFFCAFFVLFGMSMLIPVVIDT